MPTAAAPNPPAHGPVVGARTDRTSCRYHSAQPALWRCERCAALLCPACIRPVTSRDTVLECCPCGGPCSELSRAEQGATADDWREHVVRAVRYPLTNLGGIALAVAAVLLEAFTPSRLDLLAAVQIVLWVVFVGFLAEFVFDVVATSLGGEDALPEWPEFSNVLDSSIAPLIRMLAIALPLFTPAALAGGIAGNGTLAYWLCFAAGAAYFPMALAAVVAHSSIAGMLPTVVLPAIRRVGRPYAALCSLLIGAHALAALLRFVLGGVPWIGGMLAYFVALYGVVVQARLVGCLWHDFGHRIERAPG